MAPLITIGITSFNAEGHIARAISSAIAQSWEPLEIVVVDDRSSDRTFELVEQIVKSHPQVRVFRQSQNSGVAAARNRIMEEARGDFLAFFDDDDVSDPDRVATQYRRIIDYEGQLPERAPVVCHTARRQITRNGSERIERTMGCSQKKEAPSGPAVAARLLWGEPVEDGYGAVATCSQMARTSTYKMLGGFDPVFRRSEDMEFCVRLARAGGHFVGIAEPLVTQTLTYGSEKSLDKELYYKLQVIDKHRSAFKSKEHYGFSREWITTKYLWLRGHRPAFIRKLIISAITHPLLTWSRLWYALPQLDSNRSFSLFHRK
ncbi:glycosyltransferase [Rhizobium sophoriradicis]|uniref:glycosyltransferase family 2 protein n=1 Tax=Rhizobium sophoriradicis TaxID=1535245 RepID=UPI0009902BFE|nr:glycosyltransferase family 2 protein [Rhizobium sophoriradicis]RSB79577.1 glycosyltransferase [Rhizobium sophoriradicis]